MRIAALSDFHIGAWAYADEFGHREADFIEFLDRLEASHERIVLVGDIYQTEHNFLTGQRAAAHVLTRVRARMPALAGRLRSYLAVHGNHDAVTAKVFGTPERLFLNEDGWLMVFVHGHQFDPVFRRARAAAQAATWASGRLRRCGLAPLARWLEGRDVAIKHRRFGHIDGPYATAARTLMRKHRADVVIMGHTHVPYLHELPEGRLVNTGSCAHGRFTYVSLDTVQRTVEIHRVG